LTELSRPNLYLALLHYPVLGKNGDTIASAVTNLDLHDIARASRTYGVRFFYVVTPLLDQKELVDKIVQHWVSGAGSHYNPKRRDALSLIRVKTSYADVLTEIEHREGMAPKSVATSAKTRPRPLRFHALKRMLADRDTPLLLIFGTAWGLTETFIEAADHVLEPLHGGTDYNHLPVRSAAAVILDRLLGSEHTD
jgi:hypothetical protein